MKKILPGFVFAILLIWGCSGENEDNPISPLQVSGKIQLKIDKENAPADVILIEVILSREGYDNITGTLNLISDSTADI